MSTPEAFSERPSLTRSSAVNIGMLWVIIVIFYLASNGGAPILHFLGLPVYLYVFVSRCFFWMLLAGAWIYAVKIERQPLLIWKEKEYNFSTYFVSILVITAIVLVSTNLANILLFLVTHKKESSELVKNMAAYYKYHKPLLVFTCLTAGVTEELTVRGYLLPRMEKLFKKPYWAIIISSLLFGLAHYRYGTIQNVLNAAIIGLVLAIYYWKYRNIKVTIIFHFLWDLAGLLFLISRAK